MSETLTEGDGEVEGGPRPTPLEVRLAAEKALEEELRFGLPERQIDPEEHQRVRQIGSFALPATACVIAVTAVIRGFTSDESLTEDKVLHLLTGVATIPAGIMVFLRWLNREEDRHHREITFRVLKLLMSNRSDRG